MNISRIEVQLCNTNGDSWNHSKFAVRTPIAQEEEKPFHLSLHLYIIHFNISM